MKTNLILLVSLFLFLTIEISNSQDIWKSTAGPLGLSLADFVITSENMLVVSAINSGIYFSKDHGASWHKRAIGLYSPNSYATSLATGPGGILYALIDDELYRMESGSDEWDKTIYKFADSKIYANPTNNVVIVVTDFIDVSMHVSKDKGNTFKTVLSNSDFGYLEASSFNGNNNNYFVAYKSGEDALYRITDDGSDIKKIYTLTIGFVDLVWHPAGYLYVFDPFDGLIRMDSLGNNIRIIKSNAAQANVLAVKPNGNLMSFTYDADYESTDFGNNWKVLNSEIYKRVQSSDRVNFESISTYVITNNCNMDELSSTNDGGASWISFDPYFADPMITELFVTKSQNLIANSCYNAKYSYSNDKGDLWQRINVPNNFESFRDLVSTSTGNLFIRSYDILYKSNDLGQNWNEMKILGAAMFDKFTGDQNNLVYASGPGGDFISIDGGETWSVISNLPFALERVYHHPDGTLFGISSGPFGTISYSSDNGKNWAQTSIQLDYIESFHIAHDGIIYLSGFSSFNNDYGTFVSNDKLNTWNQVNTSTYNSIVSDNDGVLYGLESFGLCRKSADGGKTWKPFLSGLPAEGEATILTIDKDQYIFMGLNNDVVYRTVKPVSTTVKTFDNKSSDKIYVNPNPANEEILVRLNSKYINSGSQWNLVNTNGLSVMNNEIHSDQFTIDLKAIPNGLYFLKFDRAEIPVQKVVIQH